MNLDPTPKTLDKQPSETNYDNDKSSSQNKIKANTAFINKIRDSVIPQKTILTNEQIKKCHRFYLKALKNLAIQSYQYFELESQASLKEIAYLSEAIAKLFKDISVNCNNTNKLNKKIKSTLENYNQRYNTAIDGEILKKALKYFSLDSKNLKELAEKFLSLEMENCLMTLVDTLNSKNQEELALKAENIVFEKINNKFYHSLDFKLPVSKEFLVNNVTLTTPAPVKRSIRSIQYSQLNNIDHKKSFLPAENSMLHNSNFKEIEGYNNSSCNIQLSYSNILVIGFLFIILVKKLFS